MPRTTTTERQQLARLARPELAARQLARLNELLPAILPQNRFYAAKLAGIRTPLASWEAFRQLPFTTKGELTAAAGESGLTPNLTWPTERYVRFHQTSGTRGRPLGVLDTAEDWQWWMEVWQYVLDAAEVTAADRAFFAFSFGPFVGFWSAHDAVAERGAMVIPGGGMSTRARLELMRTSGATVVFCTPTYALRMAETAAAEGFDLRSCAVERLIVAGEPGGSLPAVRAAIERAWDARVVDHSGATEIGPWGFGDARGEGLWINEVEFIAEFFAVDSSGPDSNGPNSNRPISNENAQPGELAELVLTNLGRVGCPLLRYRTGDLVRPQWNDSASSRFVFLPGGVLGRADDMLIIRGVNIFPSSIDEIVRQFPEVAEYRVTASTTAGLDQLRIEIEDRANQPERIAQRCETQLGLRVEVACVPAGSLPRFEGKGARFIDTRNR